MKVVHILASLLGALTLGIGTALLRNLTPVERAARPVYSMRAGCPRYMRRARFCLQARCAHWWYGILGNELGVAIRDIGSLMDPHSRKDGWQGR